MPGSRAGAVPTDPQCHLDRHVETGEGLVEQEHVGLGRQGPGDGDALRLTAGELARLAPREVGDAQPLEPVAREGLPPSPGSRRGPAARRRRCPGRRGAGREVSLEHQPDPALADGQGEQVGVAESARCPPRRRARRRRGAASSCRRRRARLRPGPRPGPAVNAASTRSATRRSATSCRPGAALTVSPASGRAGRRGRRPAASSITRLRERAASWSAWRVT